MKISLDVEATPQELRTFFGLPDIEPLQQEMIEIIRKNMHVGVEGFDPTTMMKPFLPEQLQSFSTVQQAMWQAMLNQLFNNMTQKTPEESNS